MAGDSWDDGGAYEAYVGRWSRPVAREFVRWLAAPVGGAWLDFGCGSGALTETILAEASPRLVVGCDRSEGYVDHARRHISDPRARFVVASVEDLPSVDGGFDACVSGLVLNFLPSPRDAVAAFATRMRPGGTIAAYVWDYAEGMGLLRAFWDAAVALDPSARPFDEGVRFSQCRPEALRRIFGDAGLGGIELSAIETPTVFRDFDDYWRPFLGGQGPAPGYLSGLSSEHRSQLRDVIRERLLTDAEGRISLTARAWAVRGVRA